VEIGAERFAFGAREIEIRIAQGEREADVRRGVGGSAGGARADRRIGGIDHELDERRRRQRTRQSASQTAINFAPAFFTGRSLPQALWRLALSPRVSAEARGSARDT